MGVIRKKTAVRGGEGGVKYHCDVCSADITSTVRIRCAHAACKEYDLCVLCFADGKSSGTHQPAMHPYRVIEQNSFPIFDKEWGADEELLLLEGAEIYGLGSWAEIADHIGGFRHKDEVRDHYLEVYVQSSRFPLPERCSPQDTALAQEISREEFQARKKRRIEERREAARNAPALAPKTKPTSSVPSCHEIQGYMPGRLEFETEYANEAEEAVQLMQFEPGDGLNAATGQLEPEMELKMTVMDIYNCRLTQRVERKKVIFEHDLLDYRENNKLDKKRTKEERDLLNKAKPFARMLNHDDFKAFCDGLVHELFLRQAIAQLQEWRSLRIGDLESGHRYEVEKAQRLQKAVPLGSMDRERLATAQRSAKQQSAAPADAPSGAALLLAPELPMNEPLPIGTSALPDTVAAAATATAVVPGATATAATTVTMAADGNATNGANGVDSEHVHGDMPNGTNSTNGTNGVNGVNGVNGSRKEKHVTQPIPGVPLLALAQDNAPDLQLLTTEERELCQVVRLQPKPYLMIKEQILKEALKGNGTLRKKQAKEICRLDSQKGGRIFDFFVNAGWVGKA